LLLADEPTGEVDSATAQVIYDAFRTLNREFNLTTLIVSHDPAIARQVDRVVAIRDGKLASETVRQAPRESSANGANGDIASEAEEDIFEELLVLDSAGRLQIPKEYLETFDIKGRVRLEVVEDGILIKPVAQSEQRKMSETQAAELIPKAKAGGLRNIFGRMRGNKGSTAE
jgi:ABC-type multidrug transport system ATPase subunit